MDDVVRRAQQAMMDGGGRLYDALPAILAHIIRERLWAERTDAKGEPFTSFEAFVTHRYWHGLESTIEDLRAYCRKHPTVREAIDREVGALAEHGGARKREQGNNVTLKQGKDSERGNATTYTLRRLKRDRPDLAEQVVAGELSANAAAVVAGFRPRTYTLPHDPEKWARKALEVFDEAGLRALKDALP